MLEDILRIKVLRENTAAAEVKRAQYRLDQAVQAVEDRRREKQEYQQWRIREEERLFGELLNRPVAVQEIDDYKLEVANLRGRDNVYEDAIHKAQKEVSDAQEGVVKAVKVHRQAIAAREKFAEQVAEWRKEVQRLRDYQEDLEMEEFTGISSDDEDDHESEDYHTESAR